ncbi:MAG: Putative nucleoside-diphosphate-sugar epimerase, partial [uncultured Blastococcus sp.]
PAARGAPVLRHRGPRRPELRRDDAAVRRGRRAAATPDPPGAAVQPVAVQPLGRPHHAGAGRHRPPAGRVAAQHRRLPRARHRRPRARSAGGPARLRRGRPARHQARARLRRHHPLGLRVHARRPVGPAAHRSGLGRRHALRGRAHPVDDRRARRPVADRGGHRRRLGLVLLPARLGGAGRAGPARRRRRPAAGTARSAHAVRRRRTGLLAGREARAGAAAAAARGDAAARSRLAGVPRGTRRRRSAGHRAPAAGHLRATRPRRPHLLVVDRGVPRRRVRRDGPRHHQGRRATGRPREPPSYL